MFLTKLYFFRRCTHDVICLEIYFCLYVKKKEIIYKSLLWKQALQSHSKIYHLQIYVQVTIWSVNDARECIVYLNKTKERINITNITARQCCMRNHVYVSSHNTVHIPLSLSHSYGINSFVYKILLCINFPWEKIIHDLSSKQRKSLCQSILCETLGRLFPTK